ncbi:hypothetical protein HAX54_041093 [Datura stramonium]|uniref:Uncharacterized protein n=1 Tax=Datura stramonium TaxID=4076 RepID=A0ABS8RNX2_DATST|nr:hypothetical protein [Datura stramonium]
MAVPRDVTVGMAKRKKKKKKELFSNRNLSLRTPIPSLLTSCLDAAENGNLDALRHMMYEEGTKLSWNYWQKAKCLGDNLTGSIDRNFEDGDTAALHLTCLYGHLSCAALLERGASLEAKDEDGALPLHDACAGGYTEIAQLLINSALTLLCEEDAGTPGELAAPDTEPQRILDEAASAVPSH